MPYPAYQQEFNDILNSIKEGTYQDKVLTLAASRLTDKDAAELCEAMRVATEENRCYITKLSLRVNRLTTIDVKGLSQLKYLDLSDNQLTTIENIEELTQLERLSLGDNRLTTTKNIEGLTQLKSLVLYYNQLTTIGNVERLTQLKDLVLDHNQLTTLDVKGLSQLKSLSLAKNNLTTIENIEELTQLQMLYLNDNPLTTLTRAKLFSHLPADLLGDRIATLTPEEQTKVNNEFKEKVDWATRNLLFLLKENPDALKFQLQSQLEKDQGLLAPEDSVYIMSEFTKRYEMFNQHVTDDSFLFLLPVHLQGSIIHYMHLDPQDDSDSPDVETISSPPGSIKP